VEKPETYVSNVINAGAYLFSTEVFKHMAQAFDEHHKNESVVCVHVCLCLNPLKLELILNMKKWLSVFCKQSIKLLVINNGIILNTT